MATQEQRTSIVWDYAPAPESPDHVRLRDSYGLFIDGEFVDPVDGTRVPSINPATEDVVAEVAFAGAGDVARAVRGRPRRAARLGRAERARARQVPVPRRAPDPGARARARRSWSRWTAASRSASRATWTCRSPPRTSSTTRAGPTSSPTGWAGARSSRSAWRADRAVELPAADGRVEAGARARVRQHGGAEAGRDDAASPRCCSPRSSRRPSCRRAWCRSSPATARPARRSCASPTSTRSPSPARPPSARTSRPRWPGRGIPLTLELGGKSANIVFEDAAIDQAVEGIVNGIFFNQGHVCCAGSRLLIQESVAEDGRREALGADGPPARRRPARQEHRRRARSTPREQLERIEALVDERRGGGRGAPDGRLRRSPTAASGSRRRCSPTSRRRTGSRPRRSSGRSCRCSPSARRPRRSRRRTPRRTAWPPGSGPTRARRRSRSRRALQAGVVWQNTYNHFDPTAAFGGYKESGFGREGGMAGLRPYLRVAS